MTILHQLLEQIAAADPGVRKRGAYLVGTVDEVAALDPLYRQYATESDADAKAAIQWAGKRLKAIHQTGYTTLDALFAHYRLLSPKEAEGSRAEQQIIDDYRLHSHMSTLDREQRGAVAKTALNVMLLPPIFSAGRFLAGGFTGAGVGAKLDAADSYSSEPAMRNATPPRPGHEEITPLLQRLRATSEPQRRIDLVLDLAQIHNHPAALPHLAALFIRDSDPRVQETAQRAAKLIYWNALYWDLHADGSLERELAQRGAPARKTDSASASATSEQPPAAQDIAEALRRAEEARERRKRQR